jgi:hypothetical protein
VDPVDGLGAGVEEFVGMIAEAFADGIPQDVAGYVFDLIVGAENVVVVAGFPEGAAVGLAKLEGGELFEEADEFLQVALVVGAFGKDVEVIWHQAVGVKAEGMVGGAFEEQREDLLCGRFFG